MDIVKMTPFLRNILNLVVVVSLALSQTLVSAQSTFADQSVNKEVDKAPPISVNKRISQNDDEIANARSTQSQKHNKQILAPQEDESKQASQELMFIENRGQFDPQVLYRLSGNDATIDITQDALWISIVKPRDDGKRLANMPEYNSPDGPMMMATPSPKGKEPDVLEERVNIRIQYQGDLTTSNIVGINPLVLVG